MVETLRPDVVGHFDLIRLNFTKLEETGYNFETSGVNAASMAAMLEAGKRAMGVVRDNNGILDLNTAGWRKGLSHPYPDTYWTRQAHQLEIPFCFGDDSHRVEQVGYGIERAREYLRECQVPSITVLTKEEPTVNAPVVRRIIPLA